MTRLGLKRRSKSGQLIRREAETGGHGMAAEFGDKPRVFGGLKGEVVSIAGFRPDGRVDCRGRERGVLNVLSRIALMAS